MRTTLFTFLALLAIPLAVATPASADASVVVGGGSGIEVSTSDGQAKTLCTVTTVGHDRAGRLVGLTAGHCAVAGDTVAVEGALDSGPVGTVLATDAAYDYAVIEFDSSKVLPVNRIGDTTIAGVGGQVTFPDTLCKQGRSTGRTCGVAYGDILNTQQTFSQICTNSGDSGAPVVRGDTLVAMVNAFLVVPCVGPEVGTSIGSIFREIDATGGAGAGFVPVG